TGPNSPPLNHSLENKWEGDNIDLLGRDIRKKVIDGRKIRYNALWNKVCSLWKPFMRFQLIDTENDYFLAKFESYSDYSNVLLYGPWVIYGQYLTVQESIFSITAISGMVGNVIKIDLQTDKGTRGQFAKFAVQVDLRKLLVSRIRIASRIHRVEYESLPTICFKCGTLGHLRGDYPQIQKVDKMENRLGDTEEPVRSDQQKRPGSIQERVENERYGEWMAVDLRNRRQSRRNADGLEGGKGNNLSKSLFNILSKIGDSQADNNVNGTVMNGKQLDGGNRGKISKGKGHKKW
ncbi:hypothetical protein Goari_021413, partial [Gossypium aridum]|nr:hypothetical protein [Gossypium aridum]